MDDTNNIDSFVVTDQIDDDYLCVVCSKIMIAPVLMPDCVHTCCKSCALMINKSSCRKCPSCREAFSSTLRDVKLKENFIVKKLVRKLNGKCIHCNREGKLGSILDHACPETEVPCDNFGCTATIKRKDKISHLAACSMRVIKCQECDKKVTNSDLNGHQTQLCESRPSTCPLGCNVTVRRNEMNMHLLECPLGIITCPVLGCHFRAKREEMEKHEQQRAAQHVKLLNNHAGKLLDTIVKKAEPKIKKTSLQMCSFLWEIPDFKGKVAVARDATAVEPLTSTEFVGHGGRWRLLLFQNPYKLYLQLKSSLVDLRVNVRFLLLSHAGSYDDALIDLKDVTFKEGDMYGSRRPVKEAEQFAERQQGCLKVKALIELFEYDIC